MIFYELTQLYENLVRQGKISAAGWMDEKVSYAILLRENGEIEQILSLCDDKGKATFRQVPQHPSRTSGIFPFFLWDNTSYLLGVDEKGKPERSIQCFEAAAQKHLEILKDVDSGAATAIKNYFRTWKPTEAQNNPEVASIWDELMKNVNLVFWFDGKPVTEDDAIREAWERQSGRTEDGTEGICLVTGETGSIARLHPLIKGVRGAQSSGASLVSFNADSFTSYGLESGANAPTGEKAAFAYGAALNYLLNDREHVYFAGDMTVVGWVESGEEEYQDLLMAFMNQDESIHEQDIWDALERMVHGESFVWKEQKIDPDKEFYILGLSPNAARISVRFFLKNQFGSWMQNILQHESRMEIVLPSFIKNQKLPYWMMLNEMKAPGDKDNIPPLAAGMLRAILENSRYPDEMLYCTLRRCRADHDLNWKRMAMLKAYLLQNSLSEANKEGCKVALNEETNNQAYLLGRLFSILENTQEVAAGGNLNVTVKDHYFNSACSTPSLVFAQLLKLRESHMKKLYRDKPGAAVNLDKAFMDIMNRFDMEIPKQLNAEEQAVFMLGYYHQTQKKFEKKEGEQECQK